MLLRTTTALVLLAASLPAGGAAAPAEVRFYPALLHTYPLDSTRGLESVLLQNAAVVWSGGEPLAIDDVDVELIAGGAAVEVRRLGGPEVARLAAAGHRLEASGDLAAVAFQFGGEALLPKGVALAGSATLAPGQALLVAHQLFTFRGQADAVRVHVRGHTAGALVETEGSIPVRAGESRTSFRFPLKGRWYVGAGPSLHSPHRWVVPEEFALDLVKLGGDGTTHRGKGTRRGDFFAYGAPVRAAAEGRVVAAVNDEPETDADLRRPGEGADAYLARVVKSQAERLARGTRAIAGNHVVIAHPGGEFSVYAHLRTGSVRVKPGDVVRAGQPIAQLGTSGNSTEPHLHFHVCDGPDPLLCTGIPVRFEGIDLPLEFVPRALQSGDVVLARE